MREHVRKKVALYILTRKKNLRDMGKASKAAWRRVLEVANDAELREMARDGISPPPGFTNIEQKYLNRKPRPELFRGLPQREITGFVGRLPSKR